MRPYHTTSTFTTPADCLRYWAGKLGDQPFVHCSERWMTFAELETSASALASGLAETGVRAGDRIAVILPNRAEALVLLFASLKAGFVYVPLNTFLRGEFLRYQMVDSGASAVIADAAGLTEVAKVADACPELRHIVAVDGLPDEMDNQFLGRNGLALHSFAELASGPAAHSLPDVQEQDLAAILYTSGTTGMPKGCMIDHAYMISRLQPWREAGWIEDDDTLITPMPLFHGGALLCILMPALAGGMRACFEAAFSARGYLARAKMLGATYTMMPGPMGMAMLATLPAPGDVDHGLRRCALNPMKPEFQVTFERRFNTKVLTRVYGQTEAVPTFIGGWSSDKAVRADCGQIVPSLDAAIFDEQDCPAEAVGEIVVRPKWPGAMFQGYWNKPEATVEAFRNLWHHTGDLGRVSAQGYLTFVDRKKDSIRRRGENISSFELEQAIITHPDVKAVAVHGVVSTLGEEEIKACIVEETPAGLMPESFFDFLKINVPYFAIPRFVECLDQLPTNAMGRVMKQPLRERGIGNSWDFEEMGLVVPRDERRG